jgi:hypothetical protein
LAAQKEQQQQSHPTSATNSVPLNSYQPTSLVNDTIYDKLRLLNNNHRHQSIRDSCWPPRSPTSWYPHLNSHHQQEAGSISVNDSANPLTTSIMSPQSTTPIKEYSSLSPNSCKASSVNDELAKTTASKKGEWKIYLNDAGKVSMFFNQHSTLTRFTLLFYEHTQNSFLSFAPCRASRALFSLAFSSS